MKIKIIMILFASLILMGCGDSNGNANSPTYWNQISSQGSVSDINGKISTYKDEYGHIIVVVADNRSIAVTQIK